MTTKTCSKCKQVKELTCFPRYRRKEKWLTRANCKVCQSRMTKEWRKKNKEYVKEYEKKYREDNKEVVLKRQQDWREKNRKHISEYNKKKYWSDPEAHRIAAIESYYENLEENRKKAREYASLPENKERRKRNFERFVQENPEYYKDHYRRNSERYKEYQARRRQVKYASSSLLTENQIKQMQDIYWLARDLTIINGEPYEVDHIIPIKGEDICGLHVPWNLQVLPRDLNRAKRNKYNEEDAFV